MKKILLTNLLAAIFISIFLLLAPWTANFAECGCDRIPLKSFCKNSMSFTQSHTNENLAREIVPAVFPYDDLIIKI